MPKHKLSEFIAALALVGAKIDRAFYPYVPLTRADTLYRSEAGYIDLDHDAELLAVRETCWTYGLKVRPFHGVTGAKRCERFIRDDFDAAFIDDVTECVHLRR